MERLITRTFIKGIPTGRLQCNLKRVLLSFYLLIAEAGGLAVAVW